MTTLEKWEDIIKEKRKNTSFKNFLKEIASWRTVTFYKNNNLISKYPKECLKKIVDNLSFEKNRDSLIERWINFNFDKDFFKNFESLMSNVEFPATINFFWSEKCEYSDQVLASKNVYLSSVVIKECENVFYSFAVKNKSINVFNSTVITDNCENIYSSHWITRWFNIFYSKYLLDCSNTWFSSNLIGCNECILCNDLQNKTYCINNIEYSKDEYSKQKEEFLINRKNEYQKLLNNLNKRWSNFWSINCNWTYIVESENVENWCYDYRIKNWRNVFLAASINWSENFYDVFTAWNLEAKNIYWVMWTGWSENIFNSCNVPNSYNIYYSYYLENCSFCLWCIWLKNKSYCILNKEYSKEKWYELADKIFAQMDNDRILWDFFPWDLNPFYFNDTMAYIINDKFTKEEITKDWYMWRDEEIKVDIPEWSEIVNIKDLDIINFDEFILTKVIKDKSWNYYRIIKPEYDFLKKHNLPLPEIHWLDRIKLWFNF